MQIVPGAMPPVCNFQEDEKMTFRNRIAGKLSLLLTGALCLAAAVPVVHGQNATLGDTGNNTTALLREMAGTWDARQRMWTGPDATPIDMPPAVAHRQLIGDAYLEEVMEPAQASGSDSFTRTAYINYNPVSRQYEYFTLDTRAPQQMRYSSGEMRKDAVGDVKFDGGRFVASQWGDAKNVAFKYRLVVGGVDGDRQLVRLYLTPLSGRDTREFLAFEYVYTRRR